MEDKYTLTGIDGNAFNIMGYVAGALRKEGLRNLIAGYQKEATSGNYEELLCVSLDYLDKANEAYSKRLGLEDEYEDEEE